MLLTDYLKNLLTKIEEQQLTKEDIVSEIENLNYMIKDIPHIFIPFCTNAVGYAQIWFYYCEENAIWPTDYTNKNLEQAFKNCALQPKPFMYNHIRLTIEELF